MSIHHLGISLLCATLALGGCAARQRTGPPGPGMTRPAAGRQDAEASSGGAGGVWDWVFRSANEQGDLRIEQEEWHISQQGSHLSGYYNRQVVTLSTDQRPFRCNGALGYTKTTRVRVTGEIHGSRLSLREVDADAQENPCDTGARNLMSYTGEIQGDALLLQFAPGGAQYLTRRPQGMPMAGLGETPRPEAAWQGDAPRPGVRVPLDGVWEWELSTVDAEGDLRTEREEWHLAESEAEITGYYERVVNRKRPGGSFTCNGAPLISSTTRYTVKGQRFGDRLTISEIDYKTQPGPCDNALRRLDSYQGALGPNGQELILSWGPGNQLLRKRR